MSNGSTPSRTPAKADPTNPVFTVRTLTQAAAAAQAAAEAGRPIVLLSAPDAGIYAGAGWFAALMEAVRAAVPAAQFEAILDCGDDPGAAMAAIRVGIGAIVFVGRDDVATRLGAIAAERGAWLVQARPAALDIATRASDDAGSLNRTCAAALALP